MFSNKFGYNFDDRFSLWRMGMCSRWCIPRKADSITILVNDNGAMNISDTAGSPYVASAGIMMDDGVSLIADNGVITTNGKYQYGGINAYGNDINIRFKDNSHVDVESITYDAEHKNRNLIVTGGTLTYDYSADNTLWPVNEQGDKLTNFLLTKDDTHANFDALSYKGQTYTYLSDLNKETGKQYLSVWVPAAALNYMLDVDGSHDPEIIGKALEELKQAGYNFDTAYQTAEKGDQVVILRDMVVNGKSLNFTKTTDAEGNTKLIWATTKSRQRVLPALMIWSMAPSTSMRARPIPSSGAMRARTTPTPPQQRMYWMPLARIPT